MSNTGGVEVLSRPLCVLCGVNLAEKRYLKRVFKGYKPNCWSCRKRLKTGNLKQVTVLGEFICNRCGFVPEDSCQIDIDHIDGDRYNNDPSNLQYLCANCHRLKSKQNRDYNGKQYRV